MNKTNKLASVAALSAAAFLAGTTWAQQSAAPATAAANPLDVVPDKMPFDVPYGAPISLEHATVSQLGNQRGHRPGIRVRSH